MRPRAHAGGSDCLGGARRTGAEQENGSQWLQLIVQAFVGCSARRVERLAGGSLVPTVAHRRRYPARGALAPSTAETSGGRPCTVFDLDD